MRLLIPLIAAALLAGCGLKDDLFLPPPKPAAEPAAAPAGAKPAEEDEEATPNPGSPPR